MRLPLVSIDIRTAVKYCLRVASNNGDTTHTLVRSNALVLALVQRAVMGLSAQVA